MTKHNINIQDGYLFQSLKEGQIMFLELVTGRHLLGRLKRFDRFAVVLETEGKEILIYKHAIATIALAPATPASPASAPAPASPSPSSQTTP
jgi:host factor-I protein